MIGPYYIQGREEALSSTLAGTGIYQDSYCKFFFIRLQPFLVSLDVNGTSFLEAVVNMFGIGTLGSLSYVTVGLNTDHSYICDALKPFLT